MTRFFCAITFLSLLSFTSCKSSYSPAETNKHHYDYQYNIDKEKIVFEEVFDFRDKDSSELKQETERFLAKVGYNKTYEDESNLYAMGELSDVKSRFYFLFFFNTSYENCVYDLRFSFKEEKVKVIVINFYLIPENIQIRSRSWWSNPNEFGIGSSMSTTKIPTDVPKTELERYYPRYTDPDYYIFQSLRKKVTSVLNKFENTVRENEDDW